MNFITEFNRKRHKRKSGHEVAIESLCVLEEILATDRQILGIQREILDRLVPRITGIEIQISGDNMATLTAVAIWSDGFHGFDGTHVQPADWGNLAWSDTANEISGTSGDSITVTGAANDEVTLTYDSFTAQFSYAAPPLTITGVEIQAS